MFICTECNKKAYVRKTETIAPTIVRRYYQCSDVTCGHTFRCTESFDHTISPPSGRYDQLVFDALLKMPEEKRAELLQKLG